MSTDLVTRDDGLAPDVIGSAFDLASKVAKTEFVPGALRGKPDAIMACILMGREIGVGPMQSLRAIHVVDGRPAMSAELMRARALEAGHELWYDEKSSTRVTVAGRRRGSDQVSKVTWSLDDAKRAGIAGKNNWRKYPRAMLTARATAELCRDLFPDTLGGVSYVVEELEDGVADAMPSDGEPVKAEPVKSSKRGTVRRESPQRRREPAASTSGPPLPNEVSGDEDVVDAEIVDDEDEVEAEAEDLARLTKAQLVLRARDAGVEVEGTKEELVARLRGEGADFSEPSSGTVEGPGGGETSGSATSSEAMETEAGDEHHDHPFDRDGAQKAFHARLHDLRLDYEGEVRPWMADRLGTTLSRIDDAGLGKLLTAIENRPDRFVVAVQEHADPASSDSSAGGGDREAPPPVEGTTPNEEANDGGGEDVDAGVRPSSPDTPDDPDDGPSLEERAYAHADQTSPHGQLQTRIRRAWTVLANADAATYETSWATVTRLLGGQDPSTTDWTTGSEVEMRREAEHLERQVARAEHEGKVR